MTNASLKVPVASLAVLLMSAALPGANADEFTDEQLQRWQHEFMDVVNEGRRLWGTEGLGTNRLVCGQCHPNASNTHPETYPKFQKQLGRVVPIWEMINWCIRNPLEGEAMNAADPRMIALQAYINYERRGVPMAPGKH